MAEEATVTETTKTADTAVVEPEKAVETESLGDIFSINSPDPEKDVVSVKSETKSEKTDPEPEKEKEEVKESDKKNEEAEKKDEPEKKEDDSEKSKSDWESDDNPYKKQLTESKDKEKSQRDWNTQLNQKVSDLEKKSVITDKKLDGTYDPDVDDTPQATPEQIQSRGDLQGRISASTETANAKYGEEKVTEILNKFQDAFAENQAVQTRVLMSNTPIMEAIKVVEEQAFFDKYGKNPDAIRTKIREEYEKEMTERITKEVTEQLSERLSNKDSAISGLSDVSSSQANEKTESSVESLESIFTL